MIPRPAYILSEPHLSGYRVILGYETLADAQAAHQVLATSTRGIANGDEPKTLRAKDSSQ